MADAKTHKLGGPGSKSFEEENMAWKLASKNRLVMRRVY